MSLGLCISIEKVSEDASCVIYRYFTEGNAGALARMSKATGEVSLECASTDDSDAFLFGRVAFKLKKHWANWEFPDATWWAA